MAKSDAEMAALQEELADARAQIDSLQGQAADAEARANTLSERLSEAQAAVEATNADLTERGERLSGLEGELSAAREEKQALESALREAAMKYREARLAAAPHIPAELVIGETLAEIDEQLEAAGRVVSQVRDKLEEEAQSSRRTNPGVLLGSPTRRGPDLSALSPEEKIKLGLQQRQR